MLSDNVSVSPPGVVVVVVVVVGGGVGSSVEVVSKASAATMIATAIVGLTSGATCRVPK